MLVKFHQDSPDRWTQRKRWAALIQNVYAADPMICPNCGREMRIIAFINQWKVILRIMKHLDLWPPTARDPPENDSEKKEQICYS